MMRFLHPFTDAARLALLLFALAAPAVAPAAVRAQSGAPDAPGLSGVPALPAAIGVEARLITSDDTLTVGDPMELTVEVTHPTGYQVFVPALPVEWGVLEVREQSVQRTVDHGDGTATTRQSIEVVLWGPGQFATPALPITLSDPAGTLSRATAAPVAVMVASVLAQGETELRDIKPQASLPGRVVWPFIVVGTLAALLLLAGIAWLIHRRRAHRLPVDNRRPEQVAREELARVGALGLAGSGDYKQHYALVTDCLRIYLARAYRISTADRTTGELKRLLHETPMSNECALGFGQLFAEADLVKFAEFSPTPAAAGQLINEAQRLVNRSADEVAARAAAQATNATPPANAAPAGV